MKTQKNILIAFILNLSFSVIEYIGGLFTGSVAIISDSVHDLGDALSIGLAYFLEKKSRRAPDENYTFGYGRYSVLGGLMTVVILLIGSVAVIYSSVRRLIHPTQINYNGMIIFALFGVCVNFLAAWFTREGDSINQRAVNLHMLEDVLGWAVVLIGALLMRFTDISVIDPIMSIGVSLFILAGAFKNLNEIGELFLLKTPDGASVSELSKHLSEIPGVLEAHHVHMWSVDGSTIVFTCHIVAEGEFAAVKRLVKQELSEHGITHSTIELEAPGEECGERVCVGCAPAEGGHHHHHHH